MLVLPAHGPTRAVVLVLHGGKAVSKQPSLPRHLSVARLVPFAETLHTQCAPLGVAIWRARYRYRGWNGHEASPVQDARWALEEIKRVHGDVPVVLLGHSMGARTALRVADHPAVRTIVGLAPWLPDGEPIEAVRDRRVLLAHAPRDRWTSPGESADWAARARPITERLVYIRVRRAGHFMLRRSRFWTALGTAFVLEGLALDLGDERLRTGPSERGPAANVLVKAQQGQTLLRV